MNVEFLRELLSALGSSLEKAEAQQAALLQFMKDKGLVADEEFAPYLAEAEKTSGVRWRATRVRLDSLIANEKKKEERAQEEDKGKKNEPDKKEPRKEDNQGSRGSQNQKVDSSDSASNNSESRNSEAQTQPDQNEGTKAKSGGDANAVPSPRRSKGTGQAENAGGKPAKTA